eukprot:CAMPEP_0171303348 /NCGR_PEP_ID=MMETSP0816-20121228/12883_1 /TAXON_ID=420281 /ORGANISM="Proboscia inermis, Strain CCAP1064/1" /LENGTH=456 /DNA_ID=CAMNT_0011782543 /DNA_START=27 /DNA_END=1398 /DNA_ORIENTATION=+
MGETKTIIDWDKKINDIVIKGDEFDKEKDDYDDKEIVSVGIGINSDDGVDNAVGAGGATRQGNEQATHAINDHGRIQNTSGDREAGDAGNDLGIVTNAIVVDDNDSRPAISPPGTLGGTVGSTEATRIVPQPVAMAERLNHSGANKNRNIFRNRVIFSVLLAIAAAVVSVVVVISLRRSDSNSSEEESTVLEEITAASDDSSDPENILQTPAPSIALTDFPSNSPSNSPTMTKEQLIYDIVSPIYSTGAAAIFDNKSSPQYRAWQWLAFEDEYQGFNELSDLSNMVVQEHVVERYVLAVLFYETNGASWTKPMIFMNSFDVCFWDTDNVDTGEEENGSASGITLCDSESFVRNLDIKSFNMNGTIPFELSHLKRLERLDLTANNLIGTVSPELYTLSSLITFYISDNALTGTVSNDIGNLKNLEFLSFGLNAFDGTIPATLGDIEGLQQIILSKII